LDKKIFNGLWKKLQNRNQMKNDKPAIPGVWKGNSFYAGEKHFSTKSLPEGHIWCEKHPRQHYDPNKFPSCFLCHQAKTNQNK